MADYRDGAAGGRAGGVLYTIEGVASAECPVSRIDEATRAGVEQFARAKRMKEAAGAAARRPDLSAWPAREVDLFDLLELESARTESARYAAERETRD